MTAIITRATVVGGHDGRAEIEVELTYDNGGISTISLDEESCTASLDRTGVSSLDELLGQPWSIVLPLLEQPEPELSETELSETELSETELSEKGDSHARPRHP